MMATTFFLDNQNGLMIGSSVAPNSTILTREEYIALLAVASHERPVHLAELREPKVETPEEVPA
jgi:hypothetical protein